MTRAKFRCSSVVFGTNPKDGENVKTSEQVQLYPVYSSDPENPNHGWSEATPSGSIQMTITNPGAWGCFVQGQEYFVDFKPAT